MKSSNKSGLKLLRELKQHKVAVAISFFFKIAEIIFEIATIVAITTVLNQTSSPERLFFERLFKRLGIESSDMQIVLILFFVLSGLGYSGIRLLSNSYSNRFKYKIISHFRSTILALVKNVKLDVYQAMIPEELSIQVSKEVDQYATGVSEFTNFITELISILIYLSIASYLARGSIWLFAIFIIPIGCIYLAFSKRVKEKSTEIGISNRSIYTSLIIYFKGLVFMRFSFLENRFQSDLKEGFNKAHSDEQKLFVKQESMGALNEVVLTLFTAIMLAIASVQQQNLIISLILIGVFLRIAPKLNQLVKILIKIRTAYFAGSKLSQLLETLKSNQHPTKVSHILQNSFSIEIKNISFTYKNGQKEVLKDISLSIPFGSKIAIVGDSGAGKSTLLSIIAGILKPCSGKILIDDYDLKELDYSNYIKHIAYLTPNPLLFSGNLEENICGSLPHNCPYTLDKLIQITDLKQLVDGHADGKKLHIEQEGLNLSYGQRQRITIARALYQLPTLLLLDEATSNLDIHTEKNIFKKIIERYKKTTIIVVTHKLHTLKWVDKIYVLKDGCLVESGNYDELIKNNDGYFSFYLNQLT